MCADKENAFLGHLSKSSATRENKEGLGTRNSNDKRVDLLHSIDAGRANATGTVTSSYTIQGEENVASTPTAEAARSFQFPVEVSSETCSKSFTLNFPLIASNIRIY